jgi:hypothetical protein
MLYSNPVAAKLVVADCVVADLQEFGTVTLSIEF